MTRIALLVASLGALAACDQSTMSGSTAAPADAALGAPAEGEFDAMSGNVNPLCDTSAEADIRPAGSLATEEIDPGLCDTDSL